MSKARKLVSEIAFYIAFPFVMAYEVTIGLWFDGR
jgi:hypothetical protein